MDRRIRDKFITGLDLPEPMLKNCPRTELSGNRCAFIEGCKGIVEYSTQAIQLNLGEVSARYCGEKLEITSYDGENILISGVFSQISFC